MSDRDDALEEQFVDEFFALANVQDHILLALTPIEAWSVMSTIQLACRHPGFDGPTRRLAAGIARGLQARVATTPALREVAERGWNTSHDSRG